MVITFAVLADYANVTRDGKLNVMGIFDRVFARQLPGRFPVMQLVIRLDAEYAELDTEHALRIQLADPDGQPLFDINAGFTPRGGREGESASINHVVRLSDLPLHRPGRHRILIWVDGRLEREVPLKVDEAPHPPTADPDPGSEPMVH
ncbi:MAG: hypothetical protein P8177_00280 [Gemmatimonadota bacterium]|jgi:hypothetical protein